LCSVSDVQEKSDGNDDDDDFVCVEVGSTAALGNISSEIIICWDSCASLQFMTFCLVSTAVFILIFCNFRSLQVWK